METVTRGFVLDVPKWVTGLGTCLAWEISLLHRYCFPTLFFVTLFSFTISLFFSSSITIAFLFPFSLMETFYLSIALHEASHGACAILLCGSNALKSVSIIPYSIGIRTNLDEKLSLDDVCVIAFAGPFFPLLLSIIVSVAILLLHPPTWFYIYPCIFAVINVLSFIPVSGSDGKKVYCQIKQKPYLKKVLVLSLPYLFLLELKNIIWSVIG